MSEYQNNSIFWVEANKIGANPFQPRREFEPDALEDLADSIRQYGILQPLVVTRKETLRPDNNGMDVTYELIAGERRLRAAKIAGLHQVPVIIRKETDNKIKLELAIIENLQREDLNPIDRALAFEQLYKEFKLTHIEIGKRMGKSRVYVSNSLRLLSLPEEIKKGLMAGKITEGHTRPLLMLSDRPQEQDTLYKEIMIKKMSVRDAERVARKIAQDKVRKKEFIVDPRIRAFEQQLSENLGTRVHIEPKEKGGQITIDYFTLHDLEEILSSMKKVEREQSMMEEYLQKKTPRTDTQTLQESTAISFVNKNDKVQDTLTAEPFSQRLPEDTNNNITEYHQELPEYTHDKNEEIVAYHPELSPINEEKKEEDIYQNNTINQEENSPVPTESFDKPILPNNYEQIMGNDEADVLDISQQESEEEELIQNNTYDFKYPQEEDNNPAIEQNSRQDSYYSQSQNSTAYRANDGALPPDTYRQDYYQNNQNSQQRHYQQPVRKKGLLGRLFG